MTLAIEDTICRKLDTAEVTVQVRSLAVQLIPSDTIVCKVPNQMIRLWADHGGSGDTYEWSLTPNFSSVLNESDLTNGVFFYPITQTTRFYLRVKNKSCTQTFERLIYLDDTQITADFDLPEQECYQGEIVPMVTLDGYSKAYWVINETDTIKNQATTFRFLPQHNEKVKTYKIELLVWYDQCNLKKTLSKIVQVYNPVEFELSEKFKLFCDDSEAIFSLNNLKYHNDIQWSYHNDFSTTLSTKEELTVNSPNDTIIYVQVSNQECSKQDSVYIKYARTNVYLSPIDDLCKNDTVDLQVLSSFSPLQIKSVKWSPEKYNLTSDTINPYRIKPEESQRYSVNVFTLNGCETTKYIDVTVFQIDSTKIKLTLAEEIVLKGKQTILSFEPLDYNIISWQPEDKVEQPKNYKTRTKTEESVWYSIDINNGPCFYKDSVFLNVKEYKCGLPDVFIPNAFSPNGDGVNDVLYVRGNMINKLTFKVFDRWGELVFETDTLNAGWDGSFNDKKLDPAVFVYHLNATCDDGEEVFLKGNVTLLK